MRAGRLRVRITIESRALVQDALGQAVESWSTVATVPADVRMAGGGERFVRGADQEQAAVDYVVRMRYRSDVTPLTRLVWGSRVLDIESAVDPDGHGRELVCRCVERLKA